MPFPDIQKLKKFITRPALQEMLKRVYKLKQKDASQKQKAYKNPVCW